jgi:CRP-like cAMP-binding protein
MGGIKIGEEFIKKFGKKFPAEAFLAKEGEPGSTMFIISSGKLVVTKQTAAGEKTLAELKEGDFFGEMAIMGMQEKRAASVKTLAETTVLELNREAFEGLVRRSPEIAMEVIRTMTERVRDANGRIGALIHKDDRVRISSYLAFCVNEKGVDPVQTVNASGKCIPLRMRDVSSALGISPESVEKYFASAKKAKLIAQNGEWFYVPQVSYLLPFAEFMNAKEKGK